MILMTNITLSVMDATDMSTPLCTIQSTLSKQVIYLNAIMLGCQIEKVKNIDAMIESTSIQLV